MAENIRLESLSLDTLEILPEDTLGGNGQILIIQVSGKNLNEVNRSLPVFMDSLFQFLELSNEKYGTYIVLCHLVVKDAAGNLLLDYARDIEGGNSQWTVVEGVFSDWYPKPSLVPTASPPKDSVENSYPEPPTPTIQSYP